MADGKWINTAKKHAALDKDLLDQLPEENWSDVEDGDSYFSIMHVADRESKEPIDDFVRRAQDLGELKPVNNSADALIEIYRDMETKNDVPGFYNTAVTDGHQLGKCLIFNTEGKSREGSNVDRDNLASMFNRLNFDVHKHDPDEEGEVSSSSSNAIKSKITMMEHCSSLVQGAIERKGTYQCETEKGHEIRHTILQGPESIYMYYTALWNETNNLYRSHSAMESDQSIMHKLNTEIENSKTDETEKAKYEGYKIFVVVLMAHGMEGIIADPMGGDIKLSQVYKLLSNENFPAMAGKPKWVIVQACSGTDKLGISKDAVPGKGISNADADVIPWDKFHTVTDDITVWLAAFPEYPAFREEQGTWFVRAILDVVYKHSHHMHLREMFQRVQDKVREYGIMRNMAMGWDNGGQHPTEMGTLVKGKRVYLFPGINEVLKRKRSENLSVPESQKDGDHNKTVKTDDTTKTT